MSSDPPSLPSSRAANPAPEPPGPPPKGTAWCWPSPWTVPAWLCRACDGPPGTTASPPRWIPGTAGQPGPHRRAAPPSLWGPVQRWPRGAGRWALRKQDRAAPGRERAGQGPHLRNMRQALQLVVLSNVYIWKLWWLALALSGLMFDLAGGRVGARFPEPH